jgi:hypothetical protein
MGKKAPDKEVGFTSKDGNFLLRFFEDRHTYFALGGPWKAWTHVPSTTAIAKLSDPPGDALISWAARLAATAAWERSQDPTIGRETCIDAGIRAPAEVREAAGAWGTKIHTIFEALAPGSSLASDDPEVLAAWNHLQGWWNLWEVKPIMSEFMALNPDMGYAGTGDLLAIATQPGDKPRTWYFDLKTSTRIYPSAYAQIAGYALAHEAMGREPWERAAILHMPKGGALKPHIQTRSQEDRDAFVAARVLHAWGRR